MTSAKFFYTSGFFLFINFLIMVLILSAFNTLPGQGASKEVHQDKPYRLQIVPAGLFIAAVGINRAIAGSPGYILMIFKGNMTFLRRGAIFLGQSKVDDIKAVFILIYAHHKIIRFYISVDMIFIMHELNPLQHFQTYDGDGF